MSESFPTSAALPIAAALGGVLVPAGIHYLLNAETPTQAGGGIPMATDIAFALAALAVLRSRIPASLKVLLSAIAVIDDLVAIVVIAAAYSATLSIGYLGAAAAVFAVLVGLNRLGVMLLPLYIAVGAVIWSLMLKSGVHPTITGVLLAFAIPFSSRSG